MPDQPRSSARILARRWWISLLLPLTLWSSADCPTTFRPGWDEAARAPRLPYLEPPGADDSMRGCGIPSVGPEGGPGCPSLTFQHPLAVNRDLARARPGEATVYLFTSPDGRRWTRAPAPIAHSPSSLGLLITEQALYLLGSSQIPLLAERAFITGLRTTDLEHWTGCAWDICREPNRGLVDTQTVVLPDGTLRVWYYSVPLRPGRIAVDPVNMPGPHELVFADLAGDRFFARGVGYADAGLADPSVEYFQGRWWMAATKGNNSVVLASSRDGERFEATGQRLERVSVPHLVVHGDELWLVAQRYGGPKGSGPWAWLFTSRDGERWEDRGVLLDGEPAGGCTSPVLGRFQDQYVLFCAVLEGPPRPWP